MDQFWGNPYAINLTLNMGQLGGREAYFAQTFVVIGQVMYLLQDMFVQAQSGGNVPVSQISSETLQRKSRQGKLKKFNSDVKKARELNGKANKSRLAVNAARGIGGSFVLRPKKRYFC